MLRSRLESRERRMDGRRKWCDTRERKKSWKYRFQRQGQKNGSLIGEVESGGTIRRSGSKIGSVDSRGKVRKQGRLIGEVDSGGTIRQSGRSWGSGSNCCDDQGRRKVVAVIVFFGGFFD